MIQTKQATGLFIDLGLSPKILDVLEFNKFTTPTPIQHQCIPAALEGKDIVGIAQTGTGKTLAFGLPMIQQLMISGGQGLIILPTRELALQVDEVLQKIGRPLGLKTAVLIGGACSRQQLQNLRRNPHIIVSTPGRLLDHLEKKNLSLSNVKVMVLDEADRMLDIGFLPQLKQILAFSPVNRQTLLFSATMPSAIAQIAARYMKMPIRIEVAPSGTVAENVEQEIFIVNRELKTQLLEKVLTDNAGSVLIFSRTKHGAKNIANHVVAMGHSAIEMHSNKSLAQRRSALDGFKVGKYRVLVATDIAARGIDVNNISLVINFDLPDDKEDYVHRIGRTGRASNYGKAISFVTPQEKFNIRRIESLIRKAIPILDLPILPPKRKIQSQIEIFESQSGGFSRSRTDYGARQDRFSRGQTDFGPRVERSSSPRAQKEFSPRSDRSSSPRSSSSSNRFKRWR
ncbi:MAG: DEAD/DEAH box helicase [Candidatus Buchananbacteria bacterium]